MLEYPRVVLLGLLLIGLGHLGKVQNGPNLVLVLSDQRKGDLEAEQVKELFDPQIVARVRQVKEHFVAVAIGLAGGVNFQIFVAGKALVPLLGNDLVKG